MSCVVCIMSIHIVRGQLTEICGLSGSGKTQLCLSLVAHVAHSITKYEYVNDYENKENNSKPSDSKQGTEHRLPIIGRIAYIDASNSFRASRIASILHNILNVDSDNNNKNPETREENVNEETSACLNVSGSSDIKRVLECIEVLRPKDVWDTFSMLQSLSKECSKSTEKAPLLLVIDSLPHLLSPSYSSASNNADSNALVGNIAAVPNAQSQYHVWGQGLAVQIGIMAKALSNYYGMAVVV